jgi:hypothetical protein
MCRLTSTGVRVRPGAYRARGLGGSPGASRRVRCFTGPRGRFLRHARGAGHQIGGVAHEGSFPGRGLTCRLCHCHPLSYSGRLAGPLEVVAIRRTAPCPAPSGLFRAAFHSRHIPRLARPSAGTSTDTGNLGFPPPCTDRAWQVWWCGGRWMSLAATALRWMRTGTGGRQASTSPHGGASGAAPSLTPCTATAFLRSCPTVVQEPDSRCQTSFWGMLLTAVRGSGLGKQDWKPGLAVEIQGAYKACGTRFIDD